MYKLTIVLRDRERPIVVYVPTLDAAEQKFARYRWDNACLSVTLHHGADCINSWPEPKGGNYGPR